MSQSIAASDWTLPAGARPRPAAAARIPALVRGLFCLFLVSIPIETLLYYQAEDAGQGQGVTISKALGVLLIAAAASQWRTCFRKMPLAFWLLLWYVGVFASTRLWIPDSRAELFQMQLLSLAQMAALFLLSVNLLADAAFRRTALRVYGWWMAVVAVLIITGVLGVEMAEEGRSTLATQDPNLTAALLSAGALCLAGDPKLLERGRKAWHVALSMAAIALMGLVILKTGSRGGLIAFGTGFVALAACGGRRTRGARALMAAAALAVTGAFVQREFSHHTTTAARLERTLDDGDTAGRTEIYDEAWRMFQERPLLGYGGANNRYVLGARLNYPERDTHNIFLAVLTEVGLLGAWGFFAALLYGLLNGWRGARRTGDSLPFALLCSMLVTGTSITATREKLFWVILAAAVAAGLRSASRGESPAR